MGKFDVNGGYFAPLGYMKVEAGGSHEENPNGGVQVGTDANGTPNLLEEGEPVYNDFVYSDNIKAEGGMLKKHNLPDKYADKLYSEIADAFVDEAEPGDYIAENGLKKMLLRLAKAQEEQKGIAERAELEEELSQLSPEELEQLYAMIEQPVNAEVPVEQIAPETIAPEQIGGQQFKRGGNLLEGFSDVVDIVAQTNKAQKGLPVLGRLDPITANATTDVGHLAGAKSIEELVAGRTMPTVEVKGQAPLPTWQRYAGVAMDSASLVHNLMHEPDTLNVPVYEPSLPQGEVRVVPQHYQAVDPTMVAETLIGSGNATQRALRNSGLGPAAGAAVVAADYNLTNALGNALNQGWHNANEGRNNVIAANNASEFSRANFDFGVNQAQSNVANEAAKLRAQWQILKQQYDNTADAAQAQAISSQMNAIAKALSDMGDENFVMNQINSNEALYYGVGRNGISRYKRPLGFLEEYV